MASYKTHVAVATTTGIAAATGLGVGLGWAGDLPSPESSSALSLALFFAVIGGMVPDMDHDTGNALPEVAALLTTLIPLTAVLWLIPQASPAGPWTMLLVLPAHLLLHWGLQKGIKPLRPTKGWPQVVRALIVSAVCFLPFIGQLPPPTWTPLRAFGALLGGAALIQTSLPLFKKVTVHRGIFHSIPGAVIYAELVLVYLVVTMDLSPAQRLVVAGSALAGALSHLILDELYSVGFDGKRLKTKRSFGTALHFFEWSYPGTTAAAYLSIVALGALAWWRW